MKLKCHGSGGAIYAGKARSFIGVMVLLVKLFKCFKSSVQFIPMAVWSLVRLKPVCVVICIHVNV